MADKETEQYVTGEEHRARQASVSSRGNSVTIPKPALGLTVAVIVLCGLSFAAGIGYQKGHTKTSPSTSNTNSLANGTGGQRGGFGRRAGGLGQVTAVSSTSITINNQRSGSSSTYTISSSTAISDNGQTVTTSDIQNDDTVLITTSDSGSTTATRILVNPSFGGGASGSTTTPTQTD